MERDPQHDTAPKDSRLFAYLIFGVLVLVILGALTLLQRRSQFQTLAKDTEAHSVPTVAVIHPSVEASHEDLVLPGTMQANIESPIYARTSGYLKKWYRDIGSRVRQGELLAEIDTPEIDQQLAQARAELNTAQANANLSKITASRYQGLLKTDGVSQQETDNAAGDFEAKKANVQSAQANVRRLEDLESFKHIYAPFSGVITRRNTETGTLINAGTQQQLFLLAQTDPIRVYLNVPENYASSIKRGLRAYLALSQFPGQQFDGQIVRTAEAIDPATRTLLTEVDVPNKAGALLPGGYAQIHLHLKVATTRLQVPINALLFRSEGMRAVVVDASHKTHLHALTIGRDYGTTLEVLQGLEATDWIVLNPADSLDDNEQVNPKEIPQNAAPSQPAANTNGTAPGSSHSDGTGAKRQKP